MDRSPPLLGASSGHAQPLLWSLDLRCVKRCADCAPPSDGALEPGCGIAFDSRAQEELHQA
eukprot:12078971-Alexandrium_andersonii.AAC.1